jgi:S-formylglutathione hydrolase FrmB
MCVHHEPVTLYADPPSDYGQHHLSLMHGWLPFTIQAVAATVTLIAIARRNRRWHVTWLPVCAAVGAASTAALYWYMKSEGLSGGEPAPSILWIWIAVAGAAVVVMVAGWRGARWWRRGASVLAVPLSVLCAALALNLWVGYFPTVQTAWNQLTAGPLPDQTDQATVVAMQRARQVPSKGSVVPVTISSAASGFNHRGEFVYLPPAWFASNPAPRLPTLMMIGGEFNTAADWLRAGNAINTLDEFAAAHRGSAPVVVFADSGGAFNTDTECVNGMHGNSADHLTKDVVPFMEATYGVSASPASWGVVGWSMGGTCAVDLTVMHPDMFTSFEDIAGDIAPNTGTKDQTIARLFGGNAVAYASFDPATVMSRHGPYSGVAGWFDVNGSGNPASVVAGGSRSSAQTVAANSLCALGRSTGIECAVITQPGRHDWPFAETAFAAALPWLAWHVGTPGVDSVPLAQPVRPNTSILAAG